MALLRGDFTPTPFAICNGFRSEAAAQRQIGVLGGNLVPPGSVSPSLPSRWLTGGGIDREAAAPRQPGGPGEGLAPPGSVPPSPIAMADRGRYPLGSGRAAAIRESGGGLGPPRAGVSPCPIAMADRGRYRSGSGRATATRGSGGVLGPPPDQFLPLSHRDGGGELGCEGGPGSPAARHECHFRTDTSPRQMAMGEGETPLVRPGRRLESAGCDRGAASLPAAVAIAHCPTGRGRRGDAAARALDRDPRRPTRCPSSTWR